MRRAIESVELVKRNLTAGDGVQEYVHKIRLVSKARMHELLARHVGLFEGPVDVRPMVPAFILTDTASLRVQ